MSYTVCRDKIVFHRRILFAGIVMLALLGLVPMVHYDMEVTRWIAGHRLDWLVRLMGDSVFEGEIPGGGDLVVFFLIGTVLLYLASSLIDTNPRLFVLRPFQRFLAARPRWCAYLRRNRLSLEFLLVSSFCSSDLMVRGLKWMVARPRPKRVIGGYEPFSAWYQFGHHYLDQGINRASFPSGHVALSMTLVGLAYVLLYCSTGRRGHLAGGAVLVGALSFACLMAVARVMGPAHWASDVVFSMVFAWFLTHTLFFYGFQVVTVQDGNYRYRGERSCPPPWRAFKIAWYAAIAGFSYVAMVIGIRHFLAGHWPWLIGLTLFAMISARYAIGKIQAEGMFTGLGRGR